MIEKIQAVRNPLTIIAIFAGLAEVFGTGVLPFIAAANQAIYMWFLMIFPVLLIGLFFLTLNFNPRVLYAPSDFRDEANYMRLFQRASIAQKVRKIQDELEDSAEKEILVAESTVTSPQKLVVSRNQAVELITQNKLGLYQLAEELIIEKLAREFHCQPQKDMSLQNKYGGFMFDAVFEQSKGLTVVEVKLISGQFSLSSIRQSLQRIQSVILTLPKYIRAETRVILAIAYDMTQSEANIVKNKIESMVEPSLKIEVRMFALPELLKEFEINKE